MKIVRFDAGDGAVRYGYLDGELIREVDAASALAVPGAAVTGDHALSAVRLLAPVDRPHKLLAVGLNYVFHAVEVGIEKPEYLRIFNKQTTCIVGPGDGVEKPDDYVSLDYEGELAVVIGVACRDVPAERALDVIGGYTIINDVSVRELQVKSPTITLAKSLDTHGPIGPWLVTPDEIADPQNLRVQTWIGDEQVQDFNTGGMIYSIAQTIATLSSLFTLEPGDIIATGTGDGVGAAQKPMRWLKIGEKVRIEIDGLGVLENEIVAAVPGKIAAIR